MKKKDKTEPEKGSNVTVPVSAVPHLYNDRMLQWQEAQFNALRAIYDKLDEILKALKED